MIQIRVDLTQAGGYDLAPTLEKKPDPDPTAKKKRNRIPPSGKTTDPVLTAEKKSDPDPTVNNPTDNKVHLSFYIKVNIIDIF